MPKFMTYQRPTPRSSQSWGGRQGGPPHLAKGKHIKPAPEAKPAAPALPPLDALLTPKKD